MREKRKRRKDLEDPLLEKNAIILGQSVYTRRKKLGMTQMELATKAGVAISTISDIERWREVNKNREKPSGALNLRLYTIIQIGRALKMKDPLRDPLKSNTNT